MQLSGRHQNLAHKLVDELNRSYPHEMNGLQDQRDLNAWNHLKQIAGMNMYSIATKTVSYAHTAEVLQYQQQVMDVGSQQQPHHVASANRSYGGMGDEGERK